VVAETTIEDEAVGVCGVPVTELERVVDVSGLEGGVGSEGLEGVSGLEGGVGSEGFEGVSGLEGGAGSEGFEGVVGSDGGVGSSGCGVGEPGWKQKRTWETPSLGSPFLYAASVPEFVGEAYVQ
jgi:hypothetical protein